MINYPDEIAFCFNPTVINITINDSVSIGYIEMKTVDANGLTYSEKRAAFGKKCFFDQSAYLQSSFDKSDFNNVPGVVSKSPVGVLISTTLTAYSPSGSLVDSFGFDTFAVWAAMQLGERYNGDRKLTWFKNFPQTAGIYTAAASDISITSDGVSAGAVNLPSRGVFSIPLDRWSASSNRGLSLYLPASSGESTFDHTFDYTFQGLANTPVRVTYEVDDSTCGQYVRWINRHGFYDYYLFKEGDRSTQLTNEGEFLRNNMQGYNFANGYHGGTGVKQMKGEVQTMPVCAPLVDGETFDFLLQMAASPVVHLYCGKNSGGTPQWKAVNISVATFIKTRKNLQDFIATIILPETRLQSL